MSSMKVNALMPSPVDCTRTFSSTTSPSRMSRLRLTVQHTALSGIVDMLIPQEEGNLGAVAAAEA